MSDLIRREDAIDAVEMFFKDAHIEDADVHCTDMVYEINHIPTACISCFRAGSFSPWHRVEERLPRNGQLVVVIDDDGHANTATLSAMGGWWISNSNDFFQMSRVLYWMPLPEPPKEDA